MPCREAAPIGCLYTEQQLRHHGRAPDVKAASADGLLDTYEKLDHSAWPCAHVVMFTVYSALTVAVWRSAYQLVGAKTWTDRNDITLTEASYVSFGVKYFIEGALQPVVTISSRTELTDRSIPEGSHAKSRAGTRSAPAPAAHLPLGAR